MEEAQVGKKEKPKEKKEDGWNTIRWKSSSPIKKNTIEERKENERRNLTEMNLMAVQFANRRVLSH